MDGVIFKESIVRVCYFYFYIYFLAFFNFSRIGGGSVGRGVIVNQKGLMKLIVYLGRIWTLFRTWRWKCFLR